MANIELVIKIPEEIQLALINNIQLSLDQQSICNSYIKHAILTGIPLSKGHGRIIDESKITHTWYETKEDLRAEQLNCVEKHRYVFLRGTDAPTIIEAENEDKQYMFHVDLAHTDKTKEDTEEQPILDKIKVDIEELDGIYAIGDHLINNDKYIRLWDVLRIIDKYKESEEENND